MRSLSEIESRAVRHLDGTRVNVDAMARDVIALVEAVRTLQAHAGAMTGQGVQDVTSAPGRTTDSLLPKQFMEIFGTEAKRD